MPRSRRDDDYEDDRPRKKPKSAGISGVALGVIIGGGVLALLLAAGCIGVVFWGANGAKQARSQREVEESKLPTRDEFRSKWQGRLASEFVAAHGKPAFTSEYGETTTWSYDLLNSDQKLARDPVTDQAVSVYLDVDKSGRIIRVHF